MGYSSGGAVKMRHTEMMEIVATEMKTNAFAPLALLSKGEKKCNGQGDKNNDREK